MNDKELLIAAAKAAGILIYFDTDGHSRTQRGSCDRWNPLIDDGDALRLAVKLRMSLDLFDDVISAGCTPNDNECLQIEEPHKNEPMQATRRAITRASAEIGRAL